MKKEIGGYFELEEMAGEEYYPNLYKVNLGRTALLWLLETRQYKKIYLPVFLCQSVIDICFHLNHKSLYSKDSSTCYFTVHLYLLLSTFLPSLHGACLNRISENKKLPPGSFLYACIYTTCIHTKSQMHFYIN